MMSVERYVIGDIGTNCYLLINDETNETVMVDCAACPRQLVDRIRRDDLKLVAILLTHGHADHILGIEGFRKEFPGLPVYAHEKEQQVLESTRLNLSAMVSPVTIQDVTYLSSNQVIELAGFTFKVLFTPGHTPGGCCYYDEADQIVFCGDTLFCNSVGRTDFPGGSMADLVKGIKEQLFVLPDETKACPGHMDTTSIGFEKKYNPFIY